jgi:modulator of FtsH protease HflC
MFNSKSTPNLDKSTKNTRKFNAKSALLGACFLSLLFYGSTFIVYPGQTALVFSMGELTHITQTPGLQVKLPLASVNKIDRRIQILNSPKPLNIKTLDQKNMVVDSFIQWRIFDPKTFYLRFKGNAAGAEQLINTTVHDAMNPVLAQRNLKSIMVDEGNTISTDVRRAVYPKLIDMGVEVLSVQFKHIGFMPEAIDSVFERMKSQQASAVKSQHTQAELDSETIRLEAKGESDKIIAEAYQAAQVIKGEGDAQASKIYADTVGNNTEFYSFYRSLEAYRASFASKQDVLVLDSSNQFFKYFHNPSEK